MTIGEAAEHLRRNGLGRALLAAVAGPAVALVAAPVSLVLAFGLGIAAVLACLFLFPGERAVAATASAAAAPAADPYGVLEAVPDPVLLIDGAGHLVHANELAAGAFGTLFFGEALSLRFRAPEFLGVVEAALRSGEPAKASLAEGRPVGRVWAVDMMPVPGRPERWRPHLLLVFRDRTAERRIEQMRSDFVANASHELRTPLSSLIGFIETLQGPARDDRAAQARFLAIMRDQAARMSRLIDDLLSLSQIEMKRHPVPGRTVDLAELFAEIRRSLSPLIAESGLEAEYSVAPGRYVVDGERDELLQVFTNLVENACKYGAGGKRLVLSLGPGRAVGGDILASVQDFGPGIAAEHVPRLTERFYRVDVESSRAKRGTGLGLSIVRNILVRHSARLLIESEVGKGSTFSVLFHLSRSKERKSELEQQVELS